MRIGKPTKRAGLLAVLVLFGCRDLPEISTGECGNYVIEAGEDCDRPSGDPADDGTVCALEGEQNECFLLCSNGGVCPDGWVCGEDSRCREPTGTFDLAEGSPWAFPVESFDVGDVDGDGFADLIGNTPTTVSVRYGNADGTFPDHLEVRSRAPEGPLTFEDLSGDGRVDVIAPIGGGLSVLLGTEDRDLEPVVFTPFNLGDAPARIVPMSRDPINAELVVVYGDTVEYTEPGGSTLQLPPSFTAADIVGAIPSADLSQATGRHQMALAFAGSAQVIIINGTGNSLAEPPDPAGVARVDVDGNSGNGVQNIVLPGGAVVASDCSGDEFLPDCREGRGVVFADLDGVNGLDVLIDASDGPLRRTFVAFKSHPTNLTFTPPVALPDGADILAAGDFDGDSVPDLVSSFGAFVSCGPTQTICPVPVPYVAQADNPTFAVPTTFEWSSAVVGNFNGDEHLDFAASSDGVDGIFVYLNTGKGVFNRFVVNTGEEPRNLRVGDYDGDLVDDIAFYIQGPEGDSVFVTFGAASDGSSAPVAMGTFPQVEVLEPMSSLIVGGDGITDLVLVANDADARSAAVLEGSSTRRLISPFVIEGAVATRALVGRFSDSGEADLVVFGYQEIDFEEPSGPNFEPNPSLFHIEGVGDGKLSSEITQLSLSDESALFDSFCSIWASGNIVSGNGFDELLAIDGRRFCSDGVTSQILVASPNPGGGAPLELSSPVPVDDSELRGVSSAELFDADNNGTLDLVAVFEGRGADGSGAIPGGVIPAGGMAVYWNTPDGFKASPSPLQGEDYNLLAAAPVLVDADAIPELVILGDGEVLTSKLSEAKTYEPPVRAFQVFGDRMRVGDVNGDGLTDLLIADFGQVLVYLAVPKPPLGSREQEEAE